ncbi:MAG TPA: uroporphyrinogen decarboxylase family protein [Phycisphaerae bacterium]|nr:uroporphyrinogen decarboxylase family protein [Phycisphaerae bacterium]
MTRRERFLRTMRFGAPDRPASAAYFAYDSTRERWEREGLPKGVDLNEHFGMDFDPFRWQVPVNLGLIPCFEEEVLEETDEYVVRRCGDRSVVRTRKDTPPPAMPQWLSYPLRSREDWAEFRKRLDPEAPGRVPANLDQLAAQSPARDYPLGLWPGGTYGMMRNWWGLEAISYLFHDDPALVEEMMEVLTDLSLHVVDRVLRAGVQLDWVMFWEDMAYRNGPLMAPELYAKYCLPFYRKVMARVSAAGVPVVMLDSDGDVSRLIPLWLDAGITVMHPVGVASGMDVREIRRQYGRRVGFFGGIDKRALAGTRRQIEAEVVPKLEACFAEGGFIPACDHAIPPDVSLDNYTYYRQLVAQVWDRMR